MPPELVIFDCDGVLVDSEPISCRVMTEELIRIGLDINEERTNELLLGRSMPDALRIIERELGRPPPGEFAAEFRAKNMEAFRRELEPVPGVKEAIEAIDLPRCVASSGKLERVRTCLEIAGLLGLFGDRVYSSEAVERGKPFPDLFLFAAREMGADPARTVVVEDSPAGVKAGRAAGMRVLGFAARSDAADLEHLGAEVFTEMSALPDLLSSARFGQR